jgi:hypothetical protein
MTEKSKEIVLRAMQDAKGDDLERATRAFAGNSPEVLDSEYGRSGQTRRQVLDGYRQPRLEWEAAMRELQQLFARKEMP